MKAKIVNIILSFLFVSNFANAQTAKTALDNMMKMLQSNTIQTNFILKVQEGEGAKANIQTIKGIYLNSGNKFSFVTGEMKVYFDGKTQWAYAPSINEVSITSPSAKEISETNPLALIRLYRDKTTISKSEFNKTTGNFLIHLRPLDTKIDIKSIELIINKATNNPQSILIINKNGVKNSIHFSQFKKGVKTTNNDFIFNPSIYKDIEINDLR